MKISRAEVERFRHDLALLPDIISIQTSCFGGIYYYDLLSKLHLLLVKYGLKRAYYDSVNLNPKDTEFPDARPTDDALLDDLKRFDLRTLERLKIACSKIGLKVYSSGSAPLNFVDTEIVPKDIVDEHAKRIFTSSDIWVYSDTSVLDEIKNVLARKIRVGDILGYPQCCVKWMACVRTKFLEICYEHFIRNHKDYEKEELLEFLRRNVERFPVSDEVKEMHRKISIHVASTVKKYPFVFHQACGPCLDKEDTPTSKLNNEYKIFAKIISRRLHDSIIQESEKHLYEYTKNWTSVPW